MKCIDLAAKLLVLVLVLSCTGCSGIIFHRGGASGQEPEGGRAEPTPLPTIIPLRETIDAELQGRVQAIVQEAQAKVGVGAVLLETGEAIWLERYGRFPTQSVYKLPIAMAALRMVDEGETKLDQEIVITPEDFVRPGFQSPIRNMFWGHGTVMPVSELVRYSIVESDGTASDVLLDLAGGPQAVQRYLTSIGIDDVIVADSTKRISMDWETQYRNWATPNDTIDLLRALHEGKAGLGEVTTNVLLRAMSGAKFGHRRIKRGLPEGATFAHKTGTGGSQDGITGATNDAGIITLPDGRHIAIAIYIKDSSAPMWVREKVMADVARAVTTKWSSEFGVRSSKF